MTNTDRAQTIINFCDGYGDYENIFFFGKSVSVGWLRALADDLFEAEEA